MWHTVDGVMQGPVEKREKLYMHWPGLWWHESTSRKMVSTITRTGVRIWTRWLQCYRFLPSSNCLIEFLWVKLISHDHSWRNFWRLTEVVMCNTQIEQWTGISLNFCTSFVKGFCSLYIPFLEFLSSLLKTPQGFNFRRIRCSRVCGCGSGPALRCDT